MNYDDTIGVEIQSTEWQPGNGRSLGSADAGTEKSAVRAIVRITSHRARLLDKDNLYRGVKALLDSLRYSCLISGDSEKEIELKVRQIKVGKLEEKTEIEIVYA